MRTVRYTAILAVILLVVWGCQDDGPGPVPPPPPPVPVGLYWHSGASGAMVEDMVELIVFYHDSAGDPIATPRPMAAWSSSDPSVLQVLSDSLAVALDTGRAVLTATTAIAPVDMLHLAFEVIPRWQGRLVWARAPSLEGSMRMAIQEFPEHGARLLPDLGHPGSADGDPYLTSDGRWLAAIAPRPGSSLADRTIFVVDVLTEVVGAPLDSLSGHQIAPVWFPGDTLLAFLGQAPTGWEVFTARPNGSGVQQRTTLGQRAAPPFFDITPEGNVIIELGYGPASDLFEVTLSSDTVRRLTPTPTYEESMPAISPDGTMIAYVAALNGGNGAGDVWVMNRDGANARRLVPDRKRVSGAFSSNLSVTNAPSWSPDSRFVLLSWYMDPYLSDDGRSYDSWGEIYAIRVADGLAIRLTRWPWADSQPFFR